jgi:acetate---CoA ligase (ADP-forming)
MSGPGGSGRALAAFRDPASVAVVGASADPAKWGSWLARGALTGRDRRAVYLVNQRGAVIDGVASARRLRDLPEAPELVVLCVPAVSAGAVVDEALDLGVGAFLGITALDPAAGPDGADGLVDRIRKAGARLVGPNCLGLYDAAARLRLAWGEFSPGALGIVSQSGQLGLEVAGLAAASGIGVSRFVSVGSAADVTADEILADLVDHEQTRAVGLYLEGFQDGRTLVRTLQRLREAGKPTVLLTVGASEAARGAARSHTGALTSTLDVVDAACRAAGAVRVDTPAQLVDVARMIVSGPPPRGRRVAVVGDSGGQGAVAADLLTRNGLLVPALPEAVSAELAGLLPAGAAVTNPVDLAGAGEQDMTGYARVAEVVAASGAADAVLVTGYFGSFGVHAPGLVHEEVAVAGRLGAIAAGDGLPVVVHRMCDDSPAVSALHSRGVATYRTIESAALALGAATELALRPGRALSPLPGTGGWPGRAGPGYWTARTALVRAGVPYPPAALVSEASGAAAAAFRLRPPYVLKADRLTHKSDAGGLILGLADPVGVAEAFAELAARFGFGEYVLEEMDTRPHVVELIVGARQDDSFGPVVLVGAGGTEAELYQDTVVELAPVDEDEALRMVRRLRCRPLLEGWRGRPAADLDALAELVAAVSRLIASGDDPLDIELNPVRVGPGGVLAVDALVIDG